MQVVYIYQIIVSKIIDFEVKVINVQVLHKLKTITHIRLIKL